MFQTVRFFLGLLTISATGWLWAQTAVLYTGSDWCDADVQVRAIWENPTFRKSAGMSLAIVDEPEVVTDAVREEWKALAALRFELEAYPGVAVFDEKGQCVLLRQGLAWDTSAAELKGLIQEGRSRAQKIKGLLAKQDLEGAEKAIRLVLPELGLKRLRQANGLKAAWEVLEKQDPKDESGIRAALTFEPMETVYRVHDFAKKKDYEGGEACIKALLSPAAQKRLTMNQRQGLLLHTFVLHRHNPEAKAKNVALLRKVMEMDPTTHFGHAAYGMLKFLGEAVEPLNARPAPLALKPRTAVKLPKDWKSPLAQVKRSATSPVYAYAKTVLAPSTIKEICRLKGGSAFLKAFLADETWVRDFFGSGPAKPSWDVSLKMLEEIAWQVPLTDRGLKKWATAAALNAGEGDREAVLRLMVAFAEIRSRKLLARGVEDLPVGLMRYVLTPAQTNAEEILWSAKEHNVPPRSYSGVCWYAPYRTYNFFNDSVQGSDYYKAWDHVYNRREAARKVGGVCGALSYYGSVAAKAHGLPSTPGGQPAHCAYSLFVPSEMRWWLCYNVHPYTGAHFQMWHWSFDYLPLAADTFLALGRETALESFWKAEVARLKDEVQPVISPMTCEVYTNFKGTKLPAPNAMPPLTRVDEGVTQISMDQAGVAERVLLVWKGTIAFAKPSAAHFALTSDDGSDFTLAGQKIIDNDGRHGAIRKDVEANVLAGKHPFELRYFNGDGGRTLQFDVRTKYPYNAQHAAGFAQAARQSAASYDLYDAWERWLAQAEGTPLEVWEVFANAVAKGLSAHPRPAWDLLSRHALAEIEKGHGKDGLAKALARLHRAIRQDERPVAEFCNFAAILDEQAKRLDTEEQRFTLFRGALAGQAGTKDAFGIVLRWGGNRFLKDPKMTARYVNVVGQVLKNRGSEMNVGAYLDGAIREASTAGNLTAFHRLSDLREQLIAASPREPRKFDFTQSPLLSDAGLLRLSTTSQWDQPGNYRSVIDGLNAVGNFHTASESAPWAEVELAGMAMVDSVFIENVRTYNNARAVPFKVEVSEDGKSWKQVAASDQSKDEWAFTFTPVKARFVRATWTGGPNNKTFLHFRKFTVHGKKLY